MRILVTGAAGFIGSHLAEQLLADGHEVIGIDCFVDYYPRTMKEANLRVLRRHPRFTFLELDLRTAPLDGVLDGVDAVINEAAMAGLMRSWSDFGLYVGCNLLALERLIASARRTGVSRFVQASTSSVYGRDAVGDESQPTGPVSPYGVTKLAAEQLLLAQLATSDFPVVILRYFSVYGPRQRPDMAYHIFIDQVLRGEPITVFGDGQQSRSNTYVGDCVRGTIDALHHAQVGEIYNVAGGEEITILRAIQLISEAVGAEPKIQYLDARPGDQRRTSADIQKASRAFGYRPEMTAAEGLAAQVRWQLGSADEEGPSDPRPISPSVP